MDAIKEHYNNHNQTVHQIGQEIRNLVESLDGLKLHYYPDTGKGLKLNLGWVEYENENGRKKSKAISITPKSSMARVLGSITRFHKEQSGLQDPKIRLQKFWTPWINHHFFVDTDRRWSPGMAVYDWISPDGSITQEVERQNVIQIPGVKPLIPLWFAIENQDIHTKKLADLLRDNPELAKLSREIIEHLHSQINSGIAKAKAERGISKVGEMWKNQGYSRTSCRVYYSPTDDEFFAANNSEGYRGTRHSYAVYIKEGKLPDLTVPIDLSAYPELRKRIVASVKRNVIDKKAKEPSAV